MDGSGPPGTAATSQQVIPGLIRQHNGAMADLGGLREFLMSRRRAIDPWESVLPRSAVPRRAPGLRREEVAVLAGVSVDYYTRLEQGRVGHVSDQVLDAVAAALRLDQAECDHLRRLVASKRPTSSASVSRRHGQIRRTPRSALRELVRLMEPVPAILQDPHMNVLAINHVGAALTADFPEMAAQDRNIVRWLFLDPTSRHVGSGPGKTRRGTDREVLRVRAHVDRVPALRARSRAQTLPP